MQKFNRNKNFKPRRNFKRKGRFNKEKRPLTFEQMMRRFKKKVERDGLLKELRKREFYEKPAAKRRRKKAEGRKRWEKKIRTEKAMMESRRKAHRWN